MTSSRQMPSPPKKRFSRIGPNSRKRSSKRCGSDLGMFPLSPSYLMAYGYGPAGFERTARDEILNAVDAEVAQRTQGRVAHWLDRAKRKKVVSQGGSEM